MNTLRLNGLTRLPHRLWQQLQRWRAMRKFALVRRLHDRANREFSEACQLIGGNVQPPMPLFDRLDPEKRRRDAEGRN